MNRDETTDLQNDEEQQDLSSGNNFMTEEETDTM
jgi:hypothetical protein